MMAATVDDMQMQALSMSPDTKVLLMLKYEIARNMTNLINYLLILFDLTLISSF